MQQLLTEQLAVAQRAGDSLTAFTGVQVPGVLDDLYAEAVASVPLGVTWDGDSARSDPVGADRAVGVARTMERRCGR